MKHPVICHTHWDREWFAPVRFTRSLLPGFFERLFELLEENPDYCFVLDGQTLMLEDTLEALDNEKAVERFTSGLKTFADRIGVGPYYGQIDWRIAEEAAIRNLEIGLEDAERFIGKPMKVGWLLDNFGFPSQVPQIHKLFGIETIFLWRGVDFPRGQNPQTEFVWESPDGSRVFVIFALDSYRNLMRVCDFPDVARQRLKMVVDRLNPFSPSGVLPLFDGYDLDPEPEDPTRLLEVNTVLPDAFVSAVRQSSVPRSLLKGELNSGRFVCVFPGTLSTRQHLKVMNWTCEWALSRVLEPISALAGLVSDRPVTFEREWRIVLQNLVHDSIGGVSADEVHEEMEERYTRVLESLKEKLEILSTRIAGILPAGFSAFNTNTQESEVVFVRDGTLYGFKAPPGSISPVELESEAIVERGEELESFEWENDHFVFNVGDGVLRFIHDGKEITLVPTVFLDEGDTYSADLREGIPLKYTKVERRWHADDVVSLRASYVSDFVDVDVDLLLTRRPIVEMEVHVSGRGSGYALVLEMKGDANGTEVIVGMPFDVVERPREMYHDEPPEDVLPLLVAARETGVNRIFPFKDFVGWKRRDGFLGFFAKGVYSYLSTPGGGLAPILLRSVEWISKQNIEGRTGDAGPVMYVPKARMEREMTLDIALYFGSFTSLHRWLCSYLNPPILFEKSTPFPKKALHFYRGDGVIFSTMNPLPDGALCRFYNPNAEARRLEFLNDVAEVYRVVDDGVERIEKVVEIPAKRLMTFKLKLVPDFGEQPVNGGKVNVLYPSISWDIGTDRSSPDPKVLDDMRNRMVELKNEGERLLAAGRVESGLRRYELLFEAYKRLREALEYELSIAQNERMDEEERMRIANELNEMRVKRRSVELLLSVLRANGGDLE